MKILIAFVVMVVIASRVDGNFECPDTFGLFSDSEDPHRFYQCSGNTPYLMNCSSNLVFNPKNEVCDWPQNGARQNVTDDENNDINDEVPTNPENNEFTTECNNNKCQLPNCRCGGPDIPGGLPVKQVPQIVLLSLEGPVNNKTTNNLYAELFERGRKNPNNCPITATFFVSHGQTNYTDVMNLYVNGHEMAVHTLTRRNGSMFSENEWTNEVVTHREYLTGITADIEFKNVKGMKAPSLAIGGDNMFKMLSKANFTYDSSIPVSMKKYQPSWPYTLDYKIFHDCMIPPCPKKSYPGIWEIPITTWQEKNGTECFGGDYCTYPSWSSGVFLMLTDNFEKHYKTNRAPFVMSYRARWFNDVHHKRAFIKFLDYINSKPDVWIVTNWQALQWVKNPMPLSKLNSFEAFKCDYSDRVKKQLPENEHIFA